MPADTRRDPFAPLRGGHALVTGGLGFVGWNLTAYLVRELGCTVTVLDDLSNATAPESMPDGVRLVVGDVRDTEIIRPLLHEHPWIFHLACRTILTAGTDPEADLTVNSLSTLRMLEILRHERPAGFERFLYTSSTSIYGNCRHIPADELDPPNILNHYAASKWMGEVYTTLYNTSYDVATACVRYSNVFGPGQTPRNPYLGVIGKFLHAAERGEPLQIHGDGEQTRDYTFVGDVVEATALVAASPKAIGDLFNVGTGVETSVNTLATEINALYGNRSEIRHVDRRDIDNIRRRALNPEKMRVRLGWVPTVSVRDGLRRTVDAGIDRVEAWSR